MTSTPIATAGGAAAIPWRVVPPLASTAFIMVGSGVLGSLLPLRFSAMGYSPGTIGLLATAEALGLSLIHISSRAFPCSSLPA